MREDHGEFLIVQLIEVRFKKLCEIMTHTKVYHHSIQHLRFIIFKLANLMIFGKLKSTFARNTSFYFSVRKQVEEMGKDSPYYNVTPRILDLVDRKLLQIQNHPLSIIKDKISVSLGSNFKIYDNLNPIVSIENNFDLLNIPKDHVSRSPSDTYYINDKNLLRTHTSAHQVDLISSGIKDFAVFGDVYRRDEIDKFHYPVFHQMEAVRILGDKSQVSVEDAANDLKGHIEKVAQDLFGKCQKRWVDAYFPFTVPSYQLEIFYENKWVEMLGCGVIHDFVLQKSGKETQRGWAAGLGLERFAMKLFKIPDVRLFWSKDQRFLSQFTKGKITEFKQFSKYPICYKDLSLWITENYNANDLFNIIREVGGDLVENVNEISTYTDPKTGKTSKAYRIFFRSLERTLQNEEIVKYQFQIRDQINNKLKQAKLR